jgi:hypothetical protein
MVSNVIYLSHRQTFLFKFCHSNIRQHDNIMTITKLSILFYEK